MNQELELVADPEPRAIDLWNRADDRALINLVPGAVSQALLTAASSRPELFGQDEQWLRKKLREENETPNATDNRLRIMFWLEYDQAQAQNRKMNIGAVTAGVCSTQFFYQRYLLVPSKVAWLSTPPVTYVVFAQEALAFGLDQLREILELPTVGPSGRPDIKLGELKAKIVAMLDQRVKGAVTQRVENRNMNLNVSTTDAAVAHKVAAESMEDLDRRLKELIRRERKALNLPESEPIVDVSAETTTEPG